MDATTAVVTLNLLHELGLPAERQRAICQEHRRFPRGRRGGRLVARRARGPLLTERLHGGETFNLPPRAAALPGVVGVLPRVKMVFKKVRDPETKKRVADRSTIIYNKRITLCGIPEEAYRYMLGSRSAIEWIMDRYQVKTDKASGIANDPNDWSREVNDPRYILDLLARIVTVSLEVMKIVDDLPCLAVRG